MAFVLITPFCRPTYYELEYFSDFYNKLKNLFNTEEATVNIDPRELRLNQSKDIEFNICNLKRDKMDEEVKTNIQDYIDSINDSFLDKSLLEYNETKGTGIILYKDLNYNNPMIKPDKVILVFRLYE